MSPGLGAATGRMSDSAASTRRTHAAQLCGESGVVSFLTPRQNDSAEGPARASVPGGDAWLTEYPENLRLLQALIRSSAHEQRWVVESLARTLDPDLHHFDAARTSKWNDTVNV